MRQLFIDATSNAGNDTGRIDRILIVDDEPRLRSSTRRLLNRPDRLIFEAESVTEATRLLESEKVDLALLDVGLPDASGLDLLRWISQHRPDTSVIMVSGDVQIDSAIRALRDGAVEFVRKGEGSGFLLARVSDALSRRQLQREHRQMTDRLAQSERLHRFLVENSPDIIYALDHEGRFTFVNTRAESVLGLTRDELRGRLFSSVVDEADHRIAHQISTAPQGDAGGTTTVELRLMCRDRESSSPASQPVVMMVSAIALHDEAQAGTSASSA